MPRKQYRLEGLRLMIGRQVGVTYPVQRARDHLEALVTTDVAVWRRVLRAAGRAAADAWR